MRIPVIVEVDFHIMFTKFKIFMIIGDERLVEVFVSPQTLL